MNKKDHKQAVKSAALSVLDNGMSLPEAASRFGVNYNTLKDRIWRIRKKRKEAEDPHFASLCARDGVNPDSVKHAWIKVEDVTYFFKNDDPEKEVISMPDLMEDLFKTYSKGKKVKPFKYIRKTNEKCLAVVVTDDHPAMEIEGASDGSSLFDYEYNKEAFEKGYEKIFERIMQEYEVHGAFDRVEIFHLGDCADGYGGFTTRGGHKLPQNMSDVECFNAAVDVKMKLMESIVDARITNKISFRLVSNDNHAGDFGEIINSMVAKLCKMKYSKDIVEVHVLRKFIEHFTYGDHCFMLTHGKDKKHMFKGLPLVLNDKTINYVNEYIDHYKIKSKHIHLYKGDLHQLGYQRTKKFDYVNFMSFCPASAWQQHNFGDSYSGFTTLVIPKHEAEISQTNCYLDYRKNIKFE